MRRSHYVLQALLYTVVLHRFLRWRLPGYDPERNLAGVLYLFLRGMSGPDTPVVGDAPCGVFSWRPPPGLVAAAERRAGRRGAAARRPPRRRSGDAAGAGGAVIAEVDPFAADLALRAPRAAAHVQRRPAS